MWGCCVAISLCACAFCPCLARILPLLPRSQVTSFVDLANRMDALEDTLLATQKAMEANIVKAVVDRVSAAGPVASSQQRQ